MVTRAPNSDGRGGGNHHYNPITSFNPHSCPLFPTHFQLPRSTILLLSLFYFNFSLSLSLLSLPPITTTTWQFPHPKKSSTCPRGTNIIKAHGVSALVKFTSTTIMFVLAWLTTIEIIGILLFFLVSTHTTHFMARESSICSKWAL